MIKVEYTVKVNGTHKQRTKKIDMRPSTDEKGWILMADTAKRAEQVILETIIPTIPGVTAWWVRYITVL